MANLLTFHRFHLNHVEKVLCSLFIRSFTSSTFQLSESTTIIIESIRLLCACTQHNSIYYALTVSMFFLFFWGCSACALYLFLFLCVSVIVVINIIMKYYIFSIMCTICSLVCLDALAVLLWSRSQNYVREFRFVLMHVAVQAGSHSPPTQHTSF